MQRAVLQIPVEKDLKAKAAKVALSQGFSSLQEAVRIFLRKLSEEKLTFAIEETVQLSKKAIKRYDKMLDDIEKGRVRTKKFSDVESLMKHLGK